MSITVQMIAMFLGFAVGAGLVFLVEEELKSHKQQILVAATQYIREVEGKIKGSNLGPDKKEKVVALLEADGIKFTAWLDKAIDGIVKKLNETDAWLIDETVKQLDPIAKPSTSATTPGIATQDSPTSPVIPAQTVNTITQTTGTVMTSKK